MPTLPFACFPSRKNSKHLHTSEDLKDVQLTAAMDTDSLASGISSGTDSASEIEQIEDSALQSSADEPPHSPVVVVGAGLAGLCCARELSKRGINAVVLDARHRAGGRLLSKPLQGAVDLGAAWTWPGHDVHLGKLAEELNVSTYPQRSNGKDVRAPGVLFNSHWSRGTNRFSSHGTYQLIERLVESLPKAHESLVLGAVVREINVSDPEKVVIKYVQHDENSDKVETCTMTCDRIVVAAPPKIVSKSIQFVPKLEEKMNMILRGTPTWMEDVMKVVAVFKRPFWEERGMSGCAFPTSTPFSQIWDNSFKDEETGATYYALAGFVMAPYVHKWKKMNSAQVWQQVSPQLVQLFGDEVESEFMHSIHQNWRAEKWTYAKSKTDDMYFSFGSPELQHPCCNGRVYFSGTETEDEAGHMEGAVMSGLRSAKQIIASLTGQRSAE